MENIDLTFGRNELKAAMEYKYMNSAIDIKQNMFDISEQIRVSIGNDWLIDLLCSYSDLRSINTYDLMYYSLIKEMIINGTLYMTPVDIDNFAYPDKMELLNHINLKKYLNINISNDGRKNSDGFFYLNEEIKMFKIYKSDNDTPKNLENIIIKSPNGLIEFGDQPICKTAFTLYTQKTILLRVPYQTNSLKNPVAAFFYNTNPLRLKIN